jgi:NAD(P)-dependent dehydrogenase (short-subunit alcohol dehydrogenase family)
MSFPKVGAHAVVTGAGSGLGRALVRELVRRGAQVLAADLDFDAARETATLAGGQVHAFACDVAQLEQVEALGREADQLLGRVDLVINNAGVAVGGRIGEVPPADWQWIVGVNLWGVVHGCHVFVPRLRKQGAGHVLNVASAAGLISAPMMGPYNATKAAVVALTETLSVELHGSGVHATVLCPTFFQTNIAKSARTTNDDLDAIPLVEKMMRAARLQADDVARLALDGVQADERYVLPHWDGRWAWRLKRLIPDGFLRLLPKALERLR